MPLLASEQKVFFETVSKRHILFDRVWSFRGGLKRPPFFLYILHCDTEKHSVNRLFFLGEIIFNDN